MNTYPTLRTLACTLNNKLFTKAVLILFTFSLSSYAFAGKTPELVWKNPTLESGVAGEDGAIYRFPKVDKDVDALVKITGRSSSLVHLASIDLTNSGWDKAWQPQVSYNNAYAPAAADWWMEFEITFVNKGSSIPTTVEEFELTALDIDGNGDKIREYISFYNLKSYLLEQTTLLTNTSLLETVLGVLKETGRRFDGPTLNFTNIDTSGTAVMVTNTYEDKNKFKIRTGAVATAANGAADRMYSLYFKGFNYTAPVVSILPVTLTNWTATCSNSNVDLKWSTAVEVNASHFTIERSTDGKEFTDAAILVAKGNSSVLSNYSFTDKLPGSAQGIIYYRLKMVDMDGQSKSSDVKIVRIGKATAEVKILAYPNPVVDDIRITIPQQWQNKQISYQVVRSNGQTMKSYTVQSASQTERIQMSQAPAGIYIVKVSNGTETSTQTIVKSKN